MHLWGHAHRAYGVRKPGTKIRDEECKSLSICACIMDGTYQPVNKMIVVDVIPGDKVSIEHERTESGKSTNNDIPIFIDHGNDPKVTLTRRLSNSVLNGISSLNKKKIAPNNP
jgi:hypothetical protein